MKKKNMAKTSNKARDIFLGIITLLGVIIPLNFIFGLVSIFLFNKYDVLYSDSLQITILPLIRIFFKVAIILLIYRYDIISKYYSKTLIVGLIISLILSIYKVISDTILFWNV